MTRRLTSFTLILGFCLAGCGEGTRPDATNLRAPVSDASDDPGRLGIIGGLTASSSNYPHVGTVNSKGLCTGTLIAKNWVATAAHCIVSTDATKTSVGINGKSYGSDLVKIHPLFKAEAFSLGNDLALIRLKEAVPATIKPAALARTPPVPGLYVAIVGFGLTGTGATGQTGGAGVKRYGFTKIDFVLSPHILWTFDSNEKYSIAQGDSGGPAFLDGTATLAGIASGISAGSGGKYGVHGTYGFETRIDIHRDWILSIMEDG